MLDGSHKTAVEKQATLLYQSRFSLMCRVYVGSINYDANEKDVREAFLQFGPIKSIEMPHEPSISHRREKHRVSIYYLFT